MSLVNGNEVNSIEINGGILGGAAAGCLPIGSINGSQVNGIQINGAIVCPTCTPLSGSVNAPVINTIPINNAGLCISPEAEAAAAPCEPLGGLNSAPINSIQVNGTIVCPDCAELSGSVNTNTINTFPINGFGPCIPFESSVVTEEVSDGFEVSDFLETFAESITEIAQTLEVGELTELEQFVQSFVTDGFTVGDSLDLFQWVALEEGLTLTEALEHTIDAATELAEGVTLTDLVQTGFTWLAQEDLTITPELLTDLGLALVEAIQVSGAVETQNDATALLAVILTMQDVAEAGQFVELAELFNIASEYQLALQAIHELSESMTVDDEVAPSGVFFIEIDEGVEVSDLLEINQVVQNCIEESIKVEGTIALGDQVFTAWTMHTETQGVTRYTDFNVNSLAYPYAAKDDGIYLLEGDSPTASIKTGLLDFGSAKKKRIPEMFLGVTSANDVVLKVITTDNDQRFEHWYRLKRSAPTDDTTRIKMGRGLRSVYWQFELVTDGYMDLDIVEIIPFELSRRI